MAFIRGGFILRDLFWVFLLVSANGIFLGMYLILLLSWKGARLNVVRLFWFFVGVFFCFFGIFGVFMVGWFFVRFFHFRNVLTPRFSQNSPSLCWAFPSHVENACTCITLWDLILWSRYFKYRINHPYFGMLRVKMYFCERCYSPWKSVLCTIWNQGSD